MDEETAIKILKTNISRQLVKHWVIFQIPTTTIIVVNILLDITGTKLPVPFNLSLEPSYVTSASVIPAIFTGTIAATSILIGFFSVSAYNFRNSLEQSVESKFDMIIKLQSTVGRLQDTRESMTEMLQNKELKEKEKEKLTNSLNELNGTSEECNNTLKLVTLNKDAYAHQQEHLDKFMISFFSVSFILLLVELVLFLITPIARMLVYDFLYGVLFSLNGIFGGIVAFIGEFMTHHVHKEMYGKGSKQ